MNSVKDDFEKAMSELEKIVTELEKGELSLEDSLKKFEEGVELGRKCKGILNRSEAKIKKIMEDSEGNLVEGEINDEI